MEAFLQEARQLAAQQRFHSKEVEYYTVLGQRDPSSVAAPPLKPGIEQTHPPGKERPGQFGHGYNTNWAARYSWITNELSSAIKAPPPADYSWQPTEVKLNQGAGARQPPLISYPAPVVSDPGVVMGGIVLSGADTLDTTGVLVGTPVAPQEATSTGTPATPVVDAVPYPNLPVAQSVYYAEPVAAAPPPPPPPSFVLPVGQPVEQPVAQPAVQTMAVTCPPGMGPGSALQVWANGQLLRVTVPMGVAPGGVFQMQVAAPQQAQPTQPTQQAQPLPATPKADAFSLPPTKHYNYRNQGHRRNARDNDYLLYGYGGLGGYYAYSSFHHNHYLMYDRPYHCHHYHHHYHDTYYDNASYHQEENFAGIAADDAVFDNDAIGDAYGEDTVIDYDDAAFQAEMDALDAQEADLGAGGDGGGDGGGGDDVDTSDVALYGSAGPRDLPDGGRGPGDAVDRLKAKAKRALEERGKCAYGTSAPHGAAGVARAARHAAERHHAACAARLCASERIERQWQQLIDRAEESVLGSLGALTHATRPRALAPPRAASTSAHAPITLVTQCSLDRIDRLQQQLASWRGPASVALYVDEQMGSAAAAEAEEAALARLRSASSEAASQLVVSLLYRAEEPKAAEEPKTAEDDGHTPLYPINALRNLALEQATTELVLLLDVDFVPSAGLLRDLKRDGALLDELRTSRVALVLPAFEVNPAHKLPAQQAALSSLLSGCEPPAASPFHCGHFASGHAPTDFARWLRAHERYTVDYQTNFEPCTREAFEPRLVPLFSLPPSSSFSCGSRGGCRVSRRAWLCRRRREQVVGAQV